MSTFRKTVLTTAIIGAGLATTAGSAFATDCGHDNGGHQAKHESSSSDCSNSFAGKQAAAGKGLLAGSVLNNAQGAIGANVCHNLNNNQILSGNHIKMLNL